MWTKKNTWDACNVAWCFGMLVLAGSIGVVAFAMAFAGLAGFGMLAEDAEEKENKNK